MEENETDEQEMNNLNAEDAADISKEKEQASIASTEDSTEFEDESLEEPAVEIKDEFESMTEESLAESESFDLADEPENPFQPAQIDPLKSIARILDVEMNVTVQFGKTEIPLREAVSFGVGSMIELNRSVDEPVDLLVNNYPFARGEVVVIDGYYGVKITEIGSAEERSETLLKNSNSK